MSVTFFVPGSGADENELDLSNLGFVRLMQILGYDRPEWAGRFDYPNALTALRDRINQALDSDLLPLIDNGAQGWPVGYFREQLQQLQLLTQLADQRALPVRFG